jgi:hypothetical protein
MLTGCLKREGGELGVSLLPGDGSLSCGEVLRWVARNGEGLGEGWSPVLPVSGLVALLPPLAGFPGFQLAVSRGQVTYSEPPAQRKPLWPPQLSGGARLR